MQQRRDVTEFQPHDRTPAQGRPRATASRTPRRVAPRAAAVALLGLGFLLVSVTYVAAQSFPQVAATNTSSEDSAVGSHTVALPTGIQSGDLLIAFFDASGGIGSGVTITWPGGWTEFASQLSHSGSPSSGLALYFRAAYRQADGTEGASITVTTSSNASSGHNTYRITGAEDPATQAPEAATVQSTAAETTIDPPLLTPTGGAKDYLWLAVAASRGGGTLSATPTNYTNLLQDSGADATLGSSRRELNAASEDPGAFTVTPDSNRTIGATIAITLGLSAAITGTNPGSLTESNLNGATVTVTVTNGTYDASLFTTDFTLNGAPAGTTISGVVRDSATQATLTLAFDGTDFDTNASMSVTVLQAALATGTGPATTGTVTVTAAAANYYYLPPVADFPTASATFTPVTGCSLSFTPGSTLENWVVMASGQVRSSSTSDPPGAHVQMLVQGTAEGEGGVQNSPADAETGFFMMHRITGTTASQTVAVEAQDPFAGAATTTVEQCSITAFLVPSAADFQWTEVDGVSGNCLDTPDSTILTHTLNPTSSAGDYLSIVSFVSFEDPGGATNKAWITYPSGAEAPDFNVENAWGIARDARQTYVSMREETLPASPQNLTVMCDGSLGNSTILWAKAASFRMDAFEADYHDEDLTEVTLVTSSTWATHSTVPQAAPAASAEFLMLGTISGCDLGTTSGPQHGMRFREDSSGSPVVQGDSVWGITRECLYAEAFHNTLQWVEPYTTASSRTWDNQYQSTDGVTEARFAESAIHVLQFPWLPVSAAITGTTPALLTESNLNGATVTVELTDGTYDASLFTSDFTLSGAPTGTTINSVVRDSATQATLTLVFDGTDFDSNASMSVTVLQAALASGTGPATTGTVTVTAVVEVTASITGTTPASLTETNLNGATVTVTLTDGTYDASLFTTDFTLNGAPAGTTINSVVRDSATQATLTLTFDGTDFDTNASMSVTVLAGALVAGGPATTGTVTVTAVVEVSAAITGTTPPSLTESNLNGATVTVTLTDGTYQDDPPLATGDFTLNGAPAGTTISGLVRDSATQVTLTLTFDGTDFDTNASLSVTVLQAALATGTGPATTGTVTVTAVDETDLQQLHYRWRNDNGGEGTLLPLQATATADTPGETSATDVLVPGMTLTPGAGDYLVWFSGSIENSDTAGNETSYVSLYVAGTQEAHTERAVTADSSIPDTAIPVGFQARVTGGGGVGQNRGEVANHRRHNHDARTDTGSSENYPGRRQTGQRGSRPPRGRQALRMFWSLT